MLSRVLRAKKIAPARKINSHNDLSTNDTGKGHFKFGHLDFALITRFVNRPEQVCLSAVYILWSFFNKEMTVKND